jgi:hypothetical protein
MHDEQDLMVFYDQALISGVSAQSCAPYISGKYGFYSIGAICANGKKKAR